MNDPNIAIAINIAPDGVASWTVAAPETIDLDGPAARQVHGLLLYRDALAQTDQTTLTDLLRAVRNGQMTVNERTIVLAQWDPHAVC